MSGNEIFLALMMLAFFARILSGSPAMRAIAGVPLLTALIAVPIGVRRQLIRDA